MQTDSGKEVKEMTMSYVAAMLEDPHHCASRPFGAEAVLCVLNHPEQFKDERVGYSVVVLTGGHTVLKDIVRGYAVLVQYLQHAGVVAEQGWQPASSHEMKDLG